MSKFSRVQKRSNFCSIVFTPSSTMHKNFRHNIVYFSLPNTTTISECLKIVFDVVFFRRSLSSGCFSMHLGNYFLLQDNHDDMSTLDLFWQLVLPCTTFLCTHGYRTGISLPVYWLFLGLHHSWGSCWKRKRLCWVKHEIVVVVVFLF